MSIKSRIKKLCPESVKKAYRYLKDVVLFPVKYYRYNKVQNSYKKILQERKEIIKKNGGIRVGFYVVYDASWGSRTVFEKMMQDSCFAPKIVVCPDTARGIKNQETVLKNVFERLSLEYGNEYVLSSKDEKGNFIDFESQFDVIGLANPYDEMTHEYYGSEYLVKKEKLTFFNAYGYQGKLNWDIHLMKHNSYNLFWKFFVDNQATKKLAKKYQYIHGKNIIVSGSCKMDKLNSFKNKKSSERKTIIIAPHHTVRQIEGGLNLSNFLRFSELIQELPKKYPDIDFIFRPHPLLFTTLRCEDLWGDEKVDDYLNRLLENKNITYSCGGEYFSEFNMSDAMIDDCGSFLAEYFYTGKPQCYVLQNEKQFENEYIDFGKKFFNYVYKAFTAEDIYNFIENIVLKENDALQLSRNDFATNEVMINYPHASDYIVKNLKEELWQI